MIGLAILFGSIVGFALGLTGGGGGIFAVPLLVYGMSVAPREAVGISLAAVGGTAVIGVLPKLARGQVELRTGMLVAISGMLGAPLGNAVSALIPEAALLIAFSVLMLVVAWRMWTKSKPTDVHDVPLPEDCLEPSGARDRRTNTDCHRSACQRDEDGKLRLTSRCALLLIVIGLVTGFLSGMFGVGGGFVIVPALVLFSGMPIHQAVATSLFVIALVSVSGVASYLSSGGELSWETGSQFLVGGTVGMGLGSLVSKRLNGPTLQRTFASAMVLVAIFIVSKSLFLQA